MSRLSLEAFKSSVNPEETKELEKLAGGILGACHCEPVDGGGYDCDGDGTSDVDAISGASGSK